MFIRPFFFAPDEPAGGEPTSVSDASRALAAVGFDADRLGEEPAPTEPIVEPTTIADRQRAASEPAAPAAPAVPATVATPPGAPQPSPDANADAFEAWSKDPARQREAFDIMQGLTTEQGVRLIVAQGLTALGKNPDDVRAFMEGRLTQQQVLAQPTAVAPVAPPANPWDALTEEDLVDGEQAKAWFTQIREDAIAAARAEVATAQAPVQQAVRQEQQTRAGQVTDSTLIELLGEGGDPKSVDRELAGRVLVEAQKYIDPNNWESGHIRSAIIQGHHDVVQIAAAAQRAYLNRKGIVAEAVPATTGGAQAPGAEAPSEPMNLKEASKRAREMGLLG